MIHLIDISKSYGGQVLYDNITLSINDKEKIGLVGRNGHGKTTLFNLILGTVEPDSGTISIPKGYRIGHLEQHINFTQDTVLKEGCSKLPEEYKYDTWRVEKILFGLGFTKEDMERPPSTFSGGYQIRLNLAKVLISEPDLLLLDEPNNYLDIVASRWLISFLKGWQHELIVITHDRGFMDSFTTHTVGIHRGKVRKVRGTTDVLYEQIETEEEVYEKTRVNEENKRRQLTVFIDRFKAKARLASQVQSKMKMLEKMGEKEQLTKIDTLHFSFRALPFVSSKMTEIENVSFKYDTDKDNMLINNFTLTIGKHERICVIGKNGKGKSTLLKLIAQELYPVDGFVKYNPDIKLGYFGQPNLLRLTPKNSVIDEIMSVSETGSLQAARNIAGMLMFSDDHALKQVHVLSGGEKNRVMLAKIVMTPCHLLLLDEPSNHLDMDSSEALMDAIDDFDGSVVMVTHNERFLERLAKRLVVFDNNKVLLYEGGYRDFIENVGWSDEYEYEQEVVGQNNDKSSDALKSASLSQEDRKLIRKIKADARQVKSDLLKERDAVLKPLSKEINKVEKRIDTLEHELRMNDEALVKASMEQDIKLIAELPKRNKEVKAELDTLYSSFIKLAADLEKKTKEYDERVKNL